jgi:hypothetical protein
MHPVARASDTSQHARDAQKSRRNVVPSRAQRVWIRTLRGALIARIPVVEADHKSAIALANTRTNLVPCALINDETT